MPQDQETLEKQLRSEFRKARTPLIQAVKDAYKPFLLAMKKWERSNSELREQVGLLSSEFSEKGRMLRSGSRNLSEGGLSVVQLYKELAKQVKAVSSLIDKELPNLVKLYEPVGELQAAYQQAMDAYNSFIASWVGRLPEADTNGRALELALTEVERALR